jgi:GNAT superfamily N-acetyltransferase
MYVTDAALAERVERAEAADWTSLVEALAAMPGNPYGAEVGRFGNAVALAVPGMPLRSLPNRIMLAGPGDEGEVEQAAAFLKERGMRVRIDVSPHAQNGKFLQGLAGQGYRCTGFQVALYGEPDRIRNASPAPGVEVGPVKTEEDVDWLAWMYPFVFELVGGHWRQWMGDEMRLLVRHPQWRTYIARVDGQRVAAAQLRIDGGVGSLWMAGTLPEFRGRGAQGALVARRVADAAAAGCDLICTQTGVGTVSQCNMERAGLRIAYTKAEHRIVG